MRYQEYIRPKKSSYALLAVNVVGGGGGRGVRGRGFCCSPPSAAPDSVGGILNPNHYS